jgi:uncharacterized protein (TIGR02453 family)
MPFSKKTIDFLIENRLNDSKVWYQEHKEDYKKYVAEPFSEFITSLQPTINEIDSEIICNPKRFSRLYRDARFSKGGSIFRDNMWCSFERRTEQFKAIPSFYFEISPNGFDYGCGYYMASTAIMNVLRELILKNDKSYKEAINAYESQNTFQLAGDLYKKNRYPEQSERLCNWLNRKSIYLSCKSTDIDMFYSDKLSNMIAEDFKKIAPIYHFFMKADELTI